MLLLALLCNLALVDTSALYLEREVVTTIAGEEVSREKQVLYISRDKIRVELSGVDMLLIYNMDHHTMYVIEMEKKRYFMARPTTNPETFAQLPLMGVAIHVDKKLVRLDQIMKKTGRSEQITGVTCYEYELSQPHDNGAKTAIWVTRYPAYYDDQRKPNVRAIKQLWTAALGTQPPSDVRRVVSKIFNEIEGLPIRVVTRIDDEKLPVEISTTITAINSLTGLPADFFNIPSNFEIIRARGPVEDPPTWRDENGGQ